MEVSMLSTQSATVLADIDPLFQLEQKICKKICRGKIRETKRKHSFLLNYCSNRGVLGISILLMFFVSKNIYDYMDDEQQKRRKEVLVDMCDQRARMLQDQFSVNVNHVHAIAILVSTFHYYKNP
ncbi:CHASE domain containing histidine kinase protein [Perilla frutescens var. hirtella]|uniref:CHASE domain containing histidine kinase protein n=1 Tax=Perilla frutescens var. hirtella TaxID=608512 RepID=A0AAD4P061_PERFH|nr:CHASE domain containing histidine kinase protein [Perilla frutescens var. hirtella]